MRDDLTSHPDEPTPADKYHEPLERCPVCRYSLRGLPAAYRCPECGFEYDEHTRAWRLSRFSALRSFASVTVVICAVNAVVQLQMMKFGYAVRVSLQSMVLALMLLLLFVAWRSRPFIAVTPFGILYRWGWRVRSVEWVDILCAPGFEADVAFVEPQMGMSFTKFLPTKTAQAEFRRVVNDGKTRYNPASKSESQAPAATVTIQPSKTSEERSHTDAG